MTSLDGGAGAPVFVSVRPHLRGGAEDASTKGREPLVMPESGPLVDRYARIHNDLRISVTDRCNLRCVYCMPEVGMTFQPRSALLTFDEIVRVASVASKLGITALRLTGGEPLVRKGLPTLVQRLSAIGFKDLSITTNGMLLSPMVQSLANAGLKRVNISCDSLKPERFNAIRRRGDLQTVLEAMDATEAAGLSPLKLNVVILRGQNDDEILDFAAFARDTGRVVRFIEFMPLDAQGQWDNSQLVPGREIFEQINARWPLETLVNSDGAPAERFKFVDGKGEIGLISSVTQPFCGTCNRLRLTADGAIRNCLFSDDEHSLRDLMRNGVGDEVIALALRKAVWEKFPGHAINEPGFLSPTRSMSMIGG
ncbi:MAG TPA: GTP 3',8-cyclase MoaA [Acidimicrobiales bacterium]|nr:GTP 3',8-cyclase MoaA [Acidimicrobiales bacterium]